MTFSDLVHHCLVILRKMLNDRTYAGVISENRMEAIMEKIIGQKLLGLAEGLDQTATRNYAASNNPTTPNNQKSSSHLFLHPHDGLFRRVSVGWQFPLCTVAVAYCLWHMGDDRNKIGPLDFLRQS